jgi:hypothetical protein
MKVATKLAVRYTLLLIAFAFGGLSVSARVLDNFDDNTKTGWTDFLFPVGPYAQITESGGQFKFNLVPVGQSIFAASSRTSETFDLKEGRTIEYRVDLVTGNGGDSFAVLAYIPTDQTVDSLNGYGFAKSTTDILVTKSLDKYFYNENPPTAIKNDNVTMVLSLTVKNGNVIVNTKLLDKDANNAVLFERTFVDTPGADVLSDGTDNGPAYMGPGRFVLMCYEDEGDTQASYEVTFDNAETFVTDSTILDDFNDNVKTAWSDFLFPVGPYAQITEANGQFHFNLVPVGQPIFASSTKTSRTFDLADGERIEYRVDLVSGNGGDSFAVLAYVPMSETVDSLNGYGFSKSSTDILVSKSLDKYFYNENPPTAIKNENVTMVLSLTARGESVTINAKLLDKDANDAVLFERTFVDTPGVDVLSDGTDNGPAYMGPGRFILMCYEDEGDTQASYEVTFDNAEASAPPLPTNLPPEIKNISIAPSENFVAPATPLTFTVSDDVDLADADISITVNGQKFTPGNELTLSGPANNRSATFSSLIANTNYTVTIEVIDAEDVTTRETFVFDTFAASNLMIEVEDYNFFGGQFIDNPVPSPEGIGAENGYAMQIGTKGIDYDDTRTNFDTVPYRPQDNVRMQRTLDFPRAKFIAAGGAAAGIYDYDVGDIAAGEWLNYTRTFPAGTYQVYLREALRNGTQIETVLEEVTSDRTLENQTTQVIGSFITTPSGLQFRNVPLTDAIGNRITIQLSGEKTLRLWQASGAPSDGAIYQNYLIFVPVESTGVQRATITSLSPAVGSTVNTVTPRIEATIANRETTVVPASVKLYVNDSLANATVTPTAGGATVAYDITPLPPSPSLITARIEFTDSQDVTQTNEWTFTLTYNSLNAANRVSGEPAFRGFSIRVVQSPLDHGPLENSLVRADDQLAPNSPIPKYLDTNYVVDVINLTQAEGDSERTFPGDAPLRGMEFQENGTDYFSVDIQAFLELSQGIHRFYVNTDDGFKLTFGSSLTDQTTAPIAFRSGGTAEQTFDVFVPAAGLYPMRLVWYEQTGGAYAEFAWVNRTTGERTLINDPTASVFKAFTTVTAPTAVLESSAVVDSGYAPDATAVFSPGSGQYVVPMTGENRFFRFRGQTLMRLENPRILNNNIVFDLRSP